MFALINEKFSNSSLKVKIELYLLPLLFVYVLFYFYSPSQKSKKIELIKIPKIQNMKFKGSYFDLIKNLESYCSKHKLKVLSIRHSKNQIYFKVQLNKKQINKLIYKIESLNNFSKLNSFTIEKSGLQYIFDSKIDFSKYYIKKDRKTKEVKNKAVSRTSYKLQAIIDEFALINTKWLKIGSFIDGYKIKLLNKNSILLEAKNKKIKLKIYKNEKSK